MNYRRKEKRRKKKKKLNIPYVFAAVGGTGETAGCSAKRKIARSAGGKESHTEFSVVYIRNLRKMNEKYEELTRFFFFFFFFLMVPGQEELLSGRRSPDDFSYVHCI